MKIASIDIGTNTVLLVVVSFDKVGAMSTLEFRQRVPRLGRGVDASGMLSTSAIEKVIEVLHEYKSIINKHSPDSVLVAATSAVRDASNRNDFAARVLESTGYRLEILTGEEEASLTYRGVAYGFADRGPIVVVDIGGGSTELTVGIGQNPQQHISMDVGSVRITERFLAHDPPSDAEVQEATRWVDSHLEQAGILFPPAATLVGVAATATSLAILDQGLSDFSLEAVSGYILQRDRMESLLDKLRAMSSGEIFALSRVMEGRADVIVAGGLILTRIFDHWKADSMTVSERGLRYGLAVREWERIWRTTSSSVSIRD